jgi:transposase
MRLFARLACALTIFADAAYAGPLGAWVKAMFGWSLEIVHKTKSAGFHVLPKRWIVERSFAWLNNYRRLAKDYEIHPHHSEAIRTYALTAFRNWGLR